MSLPKCYVFDFDGTLKLTNQVKREGFFKVVGPSFPNSVRMHEILETCLGDRYAIFASYAFFNGGNVHELVDLYSLWCEKEILSSKDRQGALEALRALKNRGAKLYINSATPQNAIEKIIVQNYAVDVFDGVYGGFNRKSENLLEIIAAHAFDPSDVVMVGDGIDDWSAATAVGCRFVGVSGGTLQESNELSRSRLINDLSYLLP